MSTSFRIKVHLSWRSSHFRQFFTSTEFFLAKSLFNKISVGKHAIRWAKCLVAIRLSAKCHCLNITLSETSYNNDIILLMEHYRRSMFCNEFCSRMLKLTQYNNQTQAKYIVSNHVICYINLCILYVKRT